MGEAVSLVLLVLILVAAVIIVLALLLKPERLRARISLPWNAGFYIDTSRRGWQKTRPKDRGKMKTRQSQAWLVAKVWGRDKWEFPLARRKHTYIGRTRDMDIILKDLRQIRDTQ